LQLIKKSLNLLLGQLVMLLLRLVQQYLMSHLHAAWAYFEDGISKGGKPYRGYVCKAKECPPKWAKLTANGKWYFEGGE
jgi:hypothetical protein